MFIICYEPIDFDYERILQVSTTKEVEDTIMDLMTNSSYTVEKYGHGHYGEIKNIRVYETTHALPEFENFIKENEMVAQLIGQQIVQKEIDQDNEELKQRQMKKYLQLKEALGL